MPVCYPFTGGWQRRCRPAPEGPAGGGDEEQAGGGEGDGAAGGDVVGGREAQADYTAAGTEGGGQERHRADPVGPLPRRQCGHGEEGDGQERADGRHADHQRHRDDEEHERVEPPGRIAERRQAARIEGAQHEFLVEGGQHAQQRRTHHRRGHEVGPADRDDRADQVGGEVPGGARLGRQHEDAHRERAGQDDADGAGVLDLAGRAQCHDRQRHDDPDDGAAGEQADAQQRTEHHTGERGVRHGHDEERQAPQQDVDADGPGHRPHQHGLDEGQAEELLPEAVDDRAHRARRAAPRRSSRSRPAPVAAKPIV